jgi:acetyl esterase/lipase
MDTVALPEIIPLWPDVPRQPEHESNIERFGRIVRNVTQPSLTPFLPAPAAATGAAVIVIPGGGYQLLPIENEGENVARWLADHGIAAFVLRYRLFPTDVHDNVFLMQISQFARDPQAALERMKPLVVTGIEDGRQALGLVRSRAPEWGIDPAKIGILAFSGGGTIANGLIEQEDKRPSFAGLIYTPNWDGIAAPPTELPLFLALANDDPFITDGNLPLYNAWHAAGYPVELHIYAKGGHAFGMKQQGIPTDHWIEQFRDWIKVQGITA